MIRNKEASNCYNRNNNNFDLLADIDDIDTLFDLNNHSEMANNNLNSNMISYRVSLKESRESISPKSGTFLSKRIKSIKLQPKDGMVSLKSNIFLRQTTI